MLEKPNKILKRILEEENITQKDFAEMVGQYKSRISDIVNERVENNFSYQMLEQWVGLLGYELVIEAKIS